MVKVKLADQLHYSQDSVQIGSVRKGDPVTTHNAITASVVVANCTEIDATGFNAILIHAVVTVQVKIWTVAVHGAMAAGGTYAPWYEGATAMSFQTNAAKGAVWKGIPNYVKIVPTEDEDTGTLTVMYQLLNVV